MAGRDEPVALRCVGVRYAYGNREALRGVGVEVGRGMIFGLLGPNGGGKTTLFKLLATLLCPQVGEVEVLGNRLPEGAMGVRPRLGVVFQHPSLDKKLRVGENLACHGRLYGMDRGRIAERGRELLERFGLRGREGERVETLSGGLQRRVEIAKALLPGPELLLMDEPSAGLDPGVRRELWEHLAELRGAGMTVAVTTHFLDEADRCDGLAILDEGRVIAEGSPGALKAGLGGAVVRVEVEEVGRAGEVLAGLGTVDRDGEGLVVRMSVGVGEAAERVRMGLAGAGLGLRAISAAAPSLEDVYAAATGRRWGGGKG